MITKLTQKEYTKCKKETGELNVEMYVELSAKAMGLSDNPIFNSLLKLGFDPEKKTNYIFALLNEKGAYLGLSHSANIAKRFLELVDRPDRKFIEEFTRMEKIKELPRVKILERVEKPFLSTRKAWWDENILGYMRKEKIDMLLKLVE